VTSYIGGNGLLGLGELQGRSGGIRLGPHQHQSLRRLSKNPLRVNLVREKSNCEMKHTKLLKVRILFRILKLYKMAARFLEASRDTTMIL